MSFLEAPKPFLQTNAWQSGNNNSLRYNTSQAGSVLPLIYGTTRQQVNLIGFGDYRGPSGKKGKNGPLPIEGQRVGKGVGGGSKKGPTSKKSSSYSIDVAFALCQGPVDIGDTNFVWSSAGAAYFPSVGLNLYEGEYGQAADPVFESELDQVVAYAGTCYVTGTPMDLGSSPVLPNLSFEISGFHSGTGGFAHLKDANPGLVVVDFLTNTEHGAGWPVGNLDPDIGVLTTNSYADYCQAAQLIISPALQVQTEAAAWLNELFRLTNTGAVWSGTKLKLIPYGDIALDSNGASWEPNLIPEYSVNDDDFLPWEPHLDTDEPQIDASDPVLIVRKNPADAINWVSIEYLDRDNFYNKNVLPEFDQGSIDLYGLKTEASIQGNCFCNETSAGVSAKLILQRHVYVLNTYKFRLGWRYALLEPMDIVLITDLHCGLNEQPVRIMVIEEDQNGDLTITAEEVTVDSTAEDPPPDPAPPITLEIEVLNLGQLLPSPASPGIDLTGGNVGAEPLQWALNGCIMTGPGTWEIEFTGECGHESDTGLGLFTIAIEQDGVLIKTESFPSLEWPTRTPIFISDSGVFSGAATLFHIRGWYDPTFADGAELSAIGSVIFRFTPD